MKMGMRMRMRMMIDVFFFSSICVLYYYLIKLMIPSILLHSVYQKDAYSLYGRTKHATRKSRMGIVGSDTPANVV